MPSLLQNDFFVIGLISFFALFVRKNEVASALIYAGFCWISLFSSYAIEPPEVLLASSENPNAAAYGFHIMLCSVSSLLVIMLIYAVRQCMDGLLPKLLIYMCWAEILLHITSYALLLNGISWMTYNWAVLATQLSVMALFASRWSYGHSILQPRLFRDSVRGL